jgi:hypothetical protein
MSSDEKRKQRKMKDHDNSQTKGNCDRRNGWDSGLLDLDGNFSDKPSSKNIDQVEIVEFGEGQQNL